MPWRLGGVSKFLRRKIGTNYEVSHLVNGTGWLMANYSDEPPFNEKSSSNGERCSVGKAVSAAFVRWVGISKGVPKKTVWGSISWKDCLKAQSVKNV